MKMDLISSAGLLKALSQPQTNIYCSKQQIEGNTIKHVESLTSCVIAINPFKGIYRSSTPSICNISIIFKLHCVYHTKSKGNENNSVIR